MSGSEFTWIQPDWPVPSRVQARVTTRPGGVSTPPFDALNLGDHVDDAPAAVAQNRATLAARLPSHPIWLQQVHGTNVATLTRQPPIRSPIADAAISREPGVVCTVLTADCLPVFFCDVDAHVVGVAHAGWRGLASGVLAQTIDAMRVPPQHLIAYLGPAIGPQAFEVGQIVYDAFCHYNPAAKSAFSHPHSSEEGEPRWFADLYALARLNLLDLGVNQIYGGHFCTYTQQDQFFSFRRDGRTGRMASLIWLQD